MAVGLRIMAQDPFEMVRKWELTGTPDLIQVQVHNRRWGREEYPGHRQVEGTGEGGLWKPPRVVERTDPMPP